MLTRRAIIGSAAVLAAGCGGLDFSLPLLGAPRPVPLTWLSRPITGLNTGSGNESFEEKLRRIEQELADYDGSQYGPAGGRYSLALEYYEHYAGSYSDPDAELYRKSEHLAAWLGEIGADLVTVWHDEARVLGEMGVLLPLDQFGGADSSDFEREFYSPVLDVFRESGALYALPTDSFPLMLFYDVDYFAKLGIPPPDGTWDWNDLVDKALKLTERGEGGTISRWGLATHNWTIWWALWQNQAEMIDAISSQCRLQEPVAIEALEFFRDLIHLHHVSPPASGADLLNLIHPSAGSPPAMVYDTIPFGSPSDNYRRAELARGKVLSVPVESYAGIAIVAKTSNPEAAYTALRGLLHTMEPYVNVPTEREAVARLLDNRSTIQPDEVVAIQHSMEHGRALPSDVGQSRAMRNIVEALVRGDEVTSAVNQACSVLSESLET